MNYDRFAVRCQTALLFDRFAVRDAMQSNF